MTIPENILARLEVHRETLLRNGGVEARTGTRGITYRIRFRTGKGQWHGWKLPNAAVATAVAALIRKWRTENEQEKLKQLTASDNWKRVVAGCREDLESYLRITDVSEGRKRATRRTFREATKGGVGALMAFVMGLKVTPPKKAGRPRRRRLGMLSPPFDFNQPSSPTVLKPTKPRSGLSVYFAPAKTDDPQ